MELDKEKVLGLIAQFNTATYGQNVCEILAAMSCVITDVLSYSARNQNEAMLMFSMIVSSIGTDMQKRVDEGQCGWQNNKQ
jgi:hypothetical protein